MSINNCLDCNNTNENLGCNECDNCGGSILSCKCVKYEGETIAIATAGDNLCKVIQNINTQITGILQEISEIEGGESVSEITIGDGVPSGDPGSGPIVYVNSTNGDIYVWDGTTWVLKGAISLDSDLDTFTTTSTFADIGGKINITSNPDGSFTLKTIYSNGEWTLLSAASSGINVGFPDLEPMVRKRWDGYIEFDGEFTFNSPYTLLGNGASRNINLSTIPANYRPLNFKKFPAWLVISVVDGGISFPGQITIDKNTGMMSFSILGCGNMLGLAINDCSMSWETFTEVQDLTNNPSNYSGAFIHINHVNYYR